MDPERAKEKSFIPESSVSASYEAVWDRAPSAASIITPGIACIPLRFHQVATTRIPAGCITPLSTSIVSALTIPVRLSPLVFEDQVVGATPAAPSTAAVVVAVALDWFAAALMMLRRAAAAAVVMV